MPVYTARPVRLLFIHRLRDEQRFPSLDARRVQIAADVAHAEAVLREIGRMPSALIVATGRLETSYTVVVIPPSGATCATGMPARS